MATYKLQSNACGRVPRRTFLADPGMGFTGLALGAMLQRDGYASSASPWSPPSGLPSIAPKAKSVIWLFMIGGVSQLESFDPKPALNKYAGKSIAETPFKNVLDQKFLDANVRTAVPDQRKILSQLFPLQVGYSKRGESGIEVSDWWPHVGGCVDDLAIVRSMFTNDIDHGAQMQFHSGRNKLDGVFPTIGSWVHYGLGTLNENLPQFVVMGNPIADCCGGQDAHRADYLGPEHDGVPLVADPANPLAYGRPLDGVYREEQEAQFAMLNRLDRLALAEYPEDAKALARIKSYELAFRMQRAIPEVFEFQRETDSTQKLYGMDNATTAPFAKHCLAARRLVERGVRFIQIYHGGTGDAGGWDAHANLRGNHAANCTQVDKPIAGLIRDLKQRGMLDETLVVWATEFGRSPGSEKTDGRDHHPFGFSVWMAGGGIKGGVVHGATDELGFSAVENRHYVTDIHATVLQQLGLDSRRLEIPGRKRLEMEHGQVIREIIA
jgi:uncharacterized protein DUF1501